MIGVPITYLSEHCIKQFDVIGTTQRSCHDDFPDTRKYADYIEIDHKTGKPTGCGGNKTNENAVLEKNDGVHNYFVNTSGRIIQSLYSRVFIRRKDK